MMQTKLVSILSLASFALKFIKADTVTCDADNPCPEDTPCCSQYGECGTGITCLGGCDPRYSYSLDACMPLPVCQDSITIFDNYSSSLIPSYSYLGDASQGNWTYEGYPLDYTDENALILAMPQYTGGTVISSTHYVWYGKVSARMKASHDSGVVTAFVLFSSVQDEIDVEWVGADLETVQTNFYWEAVLNYTNSYNITTTNNYKNYHVYEVDWHEEYMTWSVNGEVGRTLYKNETYNSTTGKYQYPQTPSRIQISLWPGGNSTNEEGTIEWAGGEIDWDSSDIEDYGYYYAVIQSVNITCYDPPSGIVQNGSTAYKYTDSDSWYEDTVAITDDNTILASDENSGLDDNTVSNTTTTSSSESTTATANSNLSVTSTISNSKTSGATTSLSGTDTTSTSVATGFVQNSGSSTTASANNAAASFSSISWFAGLMAAIVAAF